MARQVSRTVLLLLAGMSSGCTAIKSTVHLAQAEQAVQLAREAQAPEQAPYAWTLAEQLVLKAREEWAASDFGPSETLSRQALEAANRAAEQARTAPRPEQQPPEAMLPEATTVAPDAPDAPDDPDNDAWPEGTVTDPAQPWGDQ
jgi:hypothetical protein